MAYGKAVFPWAASGRSLSIGRDEGVTKLLFDDATHRVIGCGIVGTNAGELVAEVALAIEMRADAVDVGATIHPHPTLRPRAIGMAAEMFEGNITDLILPQRKQGTDAKQPDRLAARAIASFHRAGACAPASPPFRADTDDARHEPIHCVWTKGLEPASDDPAGPA